MEQNTETFDKMLDELTITLKEKLGGDIIAEWGAGQEYYIRRQNGKQKWWKFWQEPDYIALIAAGTRIDGESIKVVNTAVNVKDERALQPIEQIFTKYQCPALIYRLYKKHN